MSDHTQEIYDVIVIGGGVSGLAVLRELSRYRLRLALVEQAPDLAMGATKANSAIVHGGFAENHDKLKGRLCYQGRKRFAALAEELDFPFKRIGSLVLAFDKNQLPELEKILDNGRKNGLPDLAILNREQILAREPAVNPEVQFGLWCEGAGIVSPYEYAIALAENAVENGAEIFLNHRVTGLKAGWPEPSRGLRVQHQSLFTLTFAHGATLVASHVVNASGLGSAEIAALAGAGGFGVHPRSGEYIIMKPGTGKLLQSVLFQMPSKMGKGILVTPTVYGNLLIGPDAIDENKDDRNTHVERLHHIFQAARLTTPNLDYKQFLRSFAGVRAVSTTDDFVIGSNQVRGFVNVAGIQSPGLTSSPAIAELTRNILVEGGLQLRLKEDFQPRRRAPGRVNPVLLPEAAASLVALPLGDKDRLLCRCEQVPEAVVRAALARTPRPDTADGIKRRTRAGMGLCQGNFCRPRLRELAASLGRADFDLRTDVEREGLTRVGREELTAYFKAHDEA